MLIVDEKIYEKIVRCRSFIQRMEEMARPTVKRGSTVFPKDPAEQKRLGVRYDYDGEITGEDGITYHKFQMQPNIVIYKPDLCLWISIVKYVEADETRRSLIFVGTQFTRHSASDAP
jgi:hypothetical protein